MVGTYKLKAGFSLIESAIVLGVVGLIIGGIWVASVQVYDNYKWKQTEEGWIYYITEIRKTWNASNYSLVPYAYKNISPWMETLPVPPGWSRSATTGQSFRPVDPYGYYLYADTNTGSIPAAKLGYAWASLPKKE